MNFLAATALLFVSPEDAFWFLIAVTERYFDKSYFDQNLTGAQAEQVFFKKCYKLIYSFCLGSAKRAGRAKIAQAFQTS